MDKAKLVTALEATLAMNDAVMGVVMLEADKRGIPSISMMNKDGTYAMVPLLHTRAMVLSSLAALRST